MALRRNVLVTFVSISETKAPKCRTKWTFCECTLFNEISDAEKDIIDIESGNDE